MVRAHSYKGELLTVTFEPGRCIHAAECVHGLPSVFDTKRAPWVDPDAAGPAAIRKVVRRCPTGALKIEGEVESREPTAEIDVQPDGPLYCRGRMRILDGAGNILRQEYRMALCRCGVSQNKPFCDNRHGAIRFMDEGEMKGEARLVSQDGGQGHLDLKPLPDGPMEVKGPLLIRDGSGRVRFTGSETWLCRCGASKNKPFCDGSHTAVGFRG